MIILLAAYPFSVHSSKIITINSTYSGANIAKAQNKEEGLQACREAHVLGAYAMYNKMMPVDVLTVALQEAEEENHCLGYAAKGDNKGTHKFSCWGITWPEGSNENLVELCSAAYEESKQSYRKWLEDGNYKFDTGT